MNVIDEDALHGKVVDPALNRLRDEIIPALESAIERRLHELMAQLSTQSGALLSGIQGIERGAVSDVSGLLTMLLMRLDGWTVSVSIPQITLKLNGPSSVKQIETGDTTK